LAARWWIGVVEQWKRQRTSGESGVNSVIVRGLVGVAFSTSNAFASASGIRQAALRTAAQPDVCFAR